jgi:hypothetical protein
MERHLTKISLVTLASCCIGFAQTGDPQSQNPAQPAPAAQADGNWHRFGDSPRQPPYSSSVQSPVQSPAQSQAPQAPAPNYNQPPPSYSVPANLTIPAGTWLTVRTTNPISTNHNQAGDAFGAVLTQPVVVNGVVVARRGQSIEGRVTEAEKAGHVKGVSKLGLELIQVVLVDGQQVPLHTQMALRNGNTSIGRDATAIGVSTGVGAAIGGAVNGGVGAGVGAGIGLAASTIGVLLTRGEPAVIYPETVLTFKTLEPITISTVNAPEAFRPVNQQDYETNTGRLVSSAPPPQPRPVFAAPYPYYPYYPYASPYAFYGYGPSFFFYGGGGRGYYGGRYGYRR